MHSFGNSCTAAFVALASVVVCAQADLKVGTTPVAAPSVAAPALEVPASRSASTARYEVLLEQELRVSQSPAARGRRFPRRDQSLLELHPTLPYERTRGQRALAGGTFISGVVPAVQPGSRQVSRRPALSVAARSISAQLTADTGGGADRQSSRPYRRLPPRHLPRPLPLLRRGPRRPSARCIAGTLGGRARDARARSRSAVLSGDAGGTSPVFFDLKGTKTVPALVDATFRYDSDIVRHIRLGRHPNNTTRIVLDFENVSRLQRVHPLQPVSHRH